MISMIAIQYLQPEPGLDKISTQSVRDQLRAAAGLLPLTHVLIGWNIPARLLDACRAETQALGIKLFRWQPLLTGDGSFHPLPEWRVRNNAGEPVLSPDGSEEFAFICPNHPSVQEQLHDHVRSLCNQYQYDGFFLDRIRFPGLGHDPLQNLGCFCEHCRRKADEQGLDLDGVWADTRQEAQTIEGRIAVVRTLLGSGESNLLEKYIQFRRSSITRLVQIIAEQIRQVGLQIGLDCFAPSLANMVGQDLRGLGVNADWVKVMTYAHVNAPAGMPYELAGLLDWLMQSGVEEKIALVEISRAARLTLPASHKELLRNGLTPAVLRTEISRGVLESSAPLLAGIELVELPGISELNDGQITNDLQAMLSINPAGLALSWDLRHIPVERLSLVAQELKRNQGF